MSPSFESPEAAERAFYSAFERGDLEAMVAVWADDPNCTCIHPMGATLRGPRAIAESWRQILSSNGDLRFALTHSVIFRDASLSVHCVHENIHHGHRFEDLSIIIATNVYRFDGEGWRMVVHHGSPGPALHSGSRQVESGRGGSGGAMH